MNTPTLKHKIDGLLKELNIEAKRSLGQNFLISQHVVSQMITVVRSSPCEELIEVGPGAGSLTDELLALGKSLQVIEMDRTFAKHWRKKISETSVIEQDALNCDWSQLPHKNSVMLVSNLPYQISSRLLIDRSVGPEFIQSMILMFQKEVAERIMAKPNTAEYSLLTIVAQTAWKIEKVVDASPSDFYPPPNVSSRVLKFELKKNVSEEFVRFCKLSFTNRRKFYLKNFDKKKEMMLKVLSDMGFTEKVRAQEISVEQYQKLFELVWLNK